MPRVTGGCACVRLGAYARLCVRLSGVHLRAVRMCAPKLRTYALRTYLCGKCRCGTINDRAKV